MNEVEAIVSKVDTFLIHLNKVELFKTTIPSESQAYMNIGKSVIMTAEKVNQVWFVCLSYLDF